MSVGSIETIEVETVRGVPAVWAHGYVDKGIRQVGTYEDGDPFFLYWLLGGSRTVTTSDGGRPEAIKYLRPEPNSPLGPRALVPLEVGRHIVDATATESRENVSTLHWQHRILRVVSLSPWLNTAQVEVVNTGVNFEWAATFDERLDDAVQVAAQLADAEHALPYIENIPHDILYGGLDKCLLSPAQALSRVRYFNDKYWKADWLKRELARHSRRWPRRQCVRSLLVPYVSFGSAALDMKMWWKVLQGECHWSIVMGELAQNLSRVQYRHDYARQYPPGIHWVELDLLARWDLRLDRPVSNSKLGWLAHAEALAAYAVYPKLLWKVGSQNLPPVYLGGFETAGQSVVLDAYLDKGRLDVSLYNPTTRFKVEGDFIWSTPLVVA